MRLRYLDADFFDRAAENATLACARSILHVCALQLQDFDRQQQQQRSQLPEIVLAQAQQQIDERPLPELGACLESLRPGLRDKLLESLLPFKLECRPILDQVPRAPPTLPCLPIFVLEIPEVDSPEEDFSIQEEIFSAQRELPLEEEEEGELAALDRQAAVLHIEPVEFQPVVVSRNFPSRVSRQIFVLESEEVDFPDLFTSLDGSGMEEHSEELAWDPQALASGLAIQPIDLGILEQLAAPQVFEKLVIIPELSLPYFPSLDQQGPKEESLFGSSTLGKVSMLETKQVDIPDAGLEEHTVAQMVDSLAMQHVQLEFLDNYIVTPQLYEKLVLVPELSLRCHLVKLLPVPALHFSDREEKVEEFIFGTLASLAKYSQPSATDFIYLDWHLSESNTCNDHRCFYFRSHHLWGLVEKIATAPAPHQPGRESSSVSQDSKLPPLEFPTEPIGPARVSEAHVSLDLKVPLRDAKRTDAKRRSGNFGVPGARLPSSQTCTGIFVVNSRLVNKHGLISRRSTYQRILAVEKGGAQVVERELRLPIDVILSPTKCLVFYSPEKLCMHEQANSVEGVSAWIESIIDNDMKAISFAFQQCIMVFEGDRRFTTAVLQNIDDVYAAAVGLSIHAQCFVSRDPANTDSIVLSCVKEAQTSATSRTFPRMTESPTVAEAFLTESPTINPLTAHAILSSEKTLAAFIAMAPPEQLAAAKPFAISSHSLQLFKSQCEYGQVERRVGRGQKNQDFIDGYGRQRAVEPLEQKPPSCSDRHEFQYFPPAAELDEEWNSGDHFTSAPYFPPAGQLDEDWDESPAIPAAHTFEAVALDDIEGREDIVSKKYTASGFGFSSNRRQSSSSSSVKDALKSWLSAREQSKKNLKRPPPAAPPLMVHDETPTRSTSTRKRKDATASVPAAATKEGGGVKRKKPSNDIFTLWENFKYRNQPAATPLLSTSRSFKRPSSSIFSSSPGQNNSSSCSVQQQHKAGGGVAAGGGKRAKRTTI
ncbi:hypothetical protein SELMODRAFT_403495 [Selaginella moellendorffii]|uniref:Uncharacterized protein n=1 Tax=Selaginella moellendorffii TaxID=88036 RepID=D8QRL2_SELML|nr:uncharacterized protein LOC9630452 [Selaginella moellendorffii]EFJ37271.1 hypothetical protein SELMODRAFT_403495 [Selaginella moellendorffii]|eukprot:XP_002962011.1 uncharacterized protein LOC9630452 [Selaginella moellendorffii]